MVVRRIANKVSKYLGLTDQTGALKDKKRSSSGNYLQYPINRTQAESEDSLLIKALEYMPPKSGVSNDQRSGTFGLKSGFDIEKAIADRTFLPGSQMSGTFNVAKIKYDKTGKIIGSQKAFKIANMGGMDARVNQGQKDNKQKIKYYIELPIPQQINDSNAVSWGEDTMNIMEMAALTVAQQAVTGGLAGAADKFESARKQILEGDTATTFPGLTDDVRRGLVAALSGQAISALGSNVSSASALGRTTGQILNSNLELLFQGVTLRTFPFNITFSPRSRDESDRVKEIIKRFKKSMAAKTGRTDFATNGGIFLKAPDIFQLKYLSNGRTHPFLNSFKPCALTNITVNYTGAGTYATYGDATPVNIKLSLVFKEINPIYAEDYEEGNLFGNNPGPGVGF